MLVLKGEGSIEKRAKLEIVYRWYIGTVDLFGVDELAIVSCSNVYRAAGKDFN